MEVREKLKAAKGATFDLRQFHEDVILCAGGLDGLEECLEMRETVRKERSKREGGGQDSLGNGAKSGEGMIVTAMAALVVASVFM